MRWWLFRLSGRKTQNPNILPVCVCLYKACYRDTPRKAFHWFVMINIRWPIISQTFSHKKRPDFCTSATYRLSIWWRAKQNLEEMFLRVYIFRCAVFAAIGSLITLMVLKFLEKNEGEAGERGEIREEEDLEELPRKEPEENDERFCWKKVRAVAYIFQCQRLRGILFISKVLISFKHLGRTFLSTMSMRVDAVIFLFSNVIYFSLCVPYIYFFVRLILFNKKKNYFIPVQLWQETSSACSCSAKYTMWL